MRETVLLVLAAVACESVSEPEARGLVPPAPRDTVRTDGDYFVPDSLSVSRGTRVVFTNQGDTHDVLFVGPGAPEDIPRGRTWSAIRAFPQPGRVGYVCSLHGTMNGVVRVE